MAGQMRSERTCGISVDYALDPLFGVALEGSCVTDCSYCGQLLEILLDGAISLRLHSGIECGGRKGRVEDGRVIGRHLVLSERTRLVLSKQ